MEQFLSHVVLIGNRYQNNGRPFAKLLLYKLPRSFNKHFFSLLSTEKHCKHYTVRIVSFMCLVCQHLYRMHPNQLLRLLVLNFEIAFGTKKKIVLIVYEHVCEQM